MSRPEEEFREFVDSRAASLHRTAYLLCGDWHLANDLVQETFVHAFRHWRRVQRADNQNAYVRRILINEFNRNWQQTDRHRQLRSDASQAGRHRRRQVLTGGISRRSPARPYPGRGSPAVTSCGVPDVRFGL
jgi:DNA-directed RNA polymerase specialized sigma24 family protein